MIGLDLGIWRGQALSYDTDAAAFFSAAGITDYTQISSVNQLVLDLKSNSLWSLMLAIYPFVGGTATTNKFNLKDPRDLSAAFRITWGGGVTHNSNGVTGNGSNGYGDTNLNVNSNMSLNSSHISVYSRTSGNANIDFSAQASSSPWFQLAIQLSGNCYYSVNGPQVSVPNSTATRLFCVSRTASNSLKVYRDGSVLGSNTGASTSMPNATFNLLCANDSGARSFYSARNLSFASIGSGLNDTQAANLATVVTAYQTALGRNV
jgi:hypothetical protein